MPEYPVWGLLSPLFWIAGTIAVGFVAGMIMGRNLSVAQAFLVGVVGTVLGGLFLWFLRPYMHLAGEVRTAYLLASLAAGVLAAMLLLHVTGLGAGTDIYRDPPHTKKIPLRYELDPTSRVGRVPSPARPEAESPAGALMFLGALLLAVGLALGILAAIKA